ncbi:phosphoenolpyruvate--protein phosphotransferase [Siculibacillus lacustris]|uniref:Phosphoenolpyruvate-protein phosphotransferase n=1 Tax=Siculibacillus lacustris TaxID=1549641 RepID=A0A4Q9VES7_9HYPH|nr:phosphoenolpyruvate--protein phosphotransferase [Siculibacillus lacustris]
MQRTLSVGVRDGLHARPAAQLVRLAKSFTSAVVLERGGATADAKSPLKLMLLGVKEADEVTLRTTGDDAAAALEQIAAFLGGAEAGIAPAPAAAPVIAASVAPTLAETGRRGVPASDGVAVGPVHVHAHPGLPEPLGRIAPEAAPAEVERFHTALADTLASVSARAGTLPGADLQPIVEALADVAGDPEWARLVEERIAGGADAVAAVLLAGTDVAGRFEAMDDAYARARAEDIRSVSRAVVGTLLGWTATSLAEVPAGAIVVADEVTALDLSGAPLERIAGFLCRCGAATSHAAIVARSHGIPAVFGWDEPLERLATAKVVALDGTTGEVHLDPDAATIADFQARIRARQASVAALAPYRTISPRTRDGRAVTVAANIGSLRDIDPALEAGAEGVGLFRTELVFMETAELPSEDQQTAIYREVIERFRPRPVTIRTLDIGGDKPIPAIAFAPEDNPFLGWRGVRMCLDRPDVFLPQIRALLRAAAAGPLRVMVPMVSDIDEVHAVKALIDTCRADLAARGVAHGRFDLGIMVETPAAALLAPALAREVAFFSIGTNDLTQYVMAADRTNRQVARLCRPDHPAVIEAVRLVCVAAAVAGIPVAVCGEAAARAEMVPILVGLGVDELSMSAPAILRVKKQVTEIWAVPPEARP